MNFRLQYISCNWRNTSLLLIIMRQYLLEINLIAFNFVILSHLNCNPNNFFDVLFIRVFLVNCLMCLNILLTVWKASKSFFGDQLSCTYNQVLVLLIFVFLFLSQYFALCFHFHQFLLRANGHEKIIQSYTLKNYTVCAYFLLQMNSLFLLVLIVLLLK